MGVGGRSWVGLTRIVLAVAVAVAVALASTCAVAADTNESARILYFETLHVTLPDAAAGTNKNIVPTALEFDAYGRRFKLTLETNANLATLVAAGGKSGDRLQLYRGIIDGAAGSWVRMATLDGKLHGLIWDGTEL